MQRIRRHTNALIIALLGVLCSTLIVSLESCSGNFWTYRSSVSCRECGCTSDSMLSVHVMKSSSHDVLVLSNPGSQPVVVDFDSSTMRDGPFSLHQKFLDAQDEHEHRGQCVLKTHDSIQFSLRQLFAPPPHLRDSERVRMHYVRPGQNHEDVRQMQLSAEETRLHTVDVIFVYHGVDNPDMHELQIQLYPDSVYIAREAAR